MTTKALRNENAVDRKMPDVFERLSKQQTNRVNSQRTSKTFNKDFKGDLKSVPNSTRKRNSPKTKTSPVTQKPRIKSNLHSVESSKEDSPSCDSYNEKALLEKVPETIGKDFAESVGCELNGFTQNNVSPSSEIHTTPSPCIGNNDSNVRYNHYHTSSPPLSDSSSGVLATDNGSGPTPCKLEHSSDKTIDFSLKNNVLCLNSLPEKEKLNRPPSQPPLHTKSLDMPLPGSDTTVLVTSKPQSLKLKLENILSATKIESADKRHGDNNGDILNKTDKFIDDDKDICEVDKESEDDDFYKVKVQTRLVSYENSTLVIRNTSKQSDSNSSSCSDSQVVGEDSSLHESLSTSSLQSSLSDQESSSSSTSVISGDVAALHPNGEGDQTRLTGVRSKLGKLVTRGKSILSDVRTYSTNYVPDVKTFSNRFHQGVASRSFRSAIASLSKDCTIPLAPPVAISSSTVQEECDTEKEQKSEVDSGFSSLISTPDHIVSGDITKSNSNPVTLLDSRRPMNLNDTPSCRLLEQNEDHEHPAPKVLPSSEENDDSVNFTKFFSSCSCQSAPMSPLEENEIQRPTWEMCACQMEMELPVEIKEILDVDHARMWWTITGNFGNILPIDWSKTYTRQKYLPVLNLNEAKKRSDGSCSDSVTPSPREDDDEEVAQDLDLHQLILAGTQQENEPVKSAEEVIKEIDDIMQEGSSSEDEGIDASSSASKDSSKMELQQLPPPLYHDKLKDLNVNELNETLMELEVVIRRYSETLIAQLAHRDELEYEKELKNTFISLLLQVQNKRRNFNVEKKKVKKPLGPNGVDPKYLTTVIPYDVGHGPPDNETIQILIKILTAINEDTPTVPTLLTDYILKVLCPS